MIHRNLCETCGGTLERIDETHYVCECCGNMYSAERVEEYVCKMKERLDDAKLEMISTARKNLYNAVTAKYISSEEIHECCIEIKKYLPDDFQANFYDGVVSKTRQEVAKMIRKIDVKKDFDCLETIIKFLICSLEIEFVIATKDLIERAYYRSDKEKYYKYTSAVENEAEKLDNFIYSTTYPRKAFVAYSSKDSEKAMELVETLEAQGISCFISIRNLRHGAGSRENYDKSLKEAMDNCTSFVFVSSMNSRNAACDALKIEIPYIKQKDINNAPGNLRNYYSRIPNEYKKPRVEYRIQESMKENFADELVDEFFDGYERVYTANDVAKRVLRQSVGFDIVSPMPEKREKTEKIEKNEIPKKNTENELKFCVACLSENSKDAQKCSQCGRERFVADFATASQIRKREMDEHLRRESEKRKQEEEKQRLEAERRKQEQERQKLEAEKRKEEEANRKREAEEARRKREAELALIAEEERKKRRKKFGILSAVAIILILTILFVWVVPLIRDNKSEPLNNNTEILNGMNNNTTNINDTNKTTNKTTNNIANNNNSTVDSDTEEDTVASDVPEVKKITFGSYPQTMVTTQIQAKMLSNKYQNYLQYKYTEGSEGAEELFDVIEENFYEYYIDGKVSNFMEYVDIEENGEKYRGVCFTSYRPNSTMSSSSADNQDDNGYTTSEMYWFIYEPISWTILSENTSDGTALILCDMIIDSQAYQNEYENHSGKCYNTSSGVPSGTYANNYAYSSIRKWLNETFYNTAFSELEKQIILTTTVDNSGASTGAIENGFACENTEDKIFLLSYQDVINSNYGFSSSYGTKDTTRQKKTTDYAQAQGASTNTSTDYAGNGYWWLRSPIYDYSSNARDVISDGRVDYSNNVRRTSFGVVPALQIKLSE